MHLLRFARFSTISSGVFRPGFRRKLLYLFTGDPHPLDKLPAGHRFIVEIPRKEISQLVLEAVKPQAVLLLLSSSAIF